MRASCSLALAVALTWVPAALASAHWHRARTPHFTLYESGDREDALRLARGLERMADVVEEMGLGPADGRHTRTVLIAFPDEASFRPHQPFYDGRRLDLAGYNAHTPYGDWIGFVASTEQGRLVAHHEYTHTIVADAFRRVPSCLNEGLAEYFSTFREHERTVEFGHPIEAHRHVLAEQDLLSLDQLFAVGNSAPAYNDPARSALFYAESWALVYYLSGLPGLTGLLMEYVDWIAGGAAPRDAFKALYPKESWDRMPEKLRATVTSSRLTFHQRVYDEPLSRITVAVEDVSEDEVQANVGVWRAANPAMDARETARIFAGAARGAPGLASAGQGVLALGAGNLDEAATHFRAAGASDDPVAVSIAGIGMIQAGQTRDRAGHDPFVTEGHGILARAVAHDSSDALARKWLAASAASADVGGLPVWAAADSVEALVQARRYDEALALLDRVAATLGPERALSVTQARETIERHRATDRAVREYNLGATAANRGDYLEAQRHLAQARDLAPDAGLKARASDDLARIAGLYEYNQGVDAQATDAAAALSWFEKAYQAARSDTLKAMAAERVKALKRRGPAKGKP